MTEKAPLLIPIEDGIQYVLTQNKEKPAVLQIILHPQRSIVVDRMAVCWSNDVFSVVEDPHAVWKVRERGGYVKAIIKNDKQVPISIAVSQDNGGSILSVPVNSMLVGLNCYKDCFVCCTSQLLVVDRYAISLLSDFMQAVFMITPQLYHINITRVGFEGVVFLQARGEIMQRSLSQDESMYVKADCVVAYQESCTVTTDTTHPTGSFGSIIYKIRGPGSVYYTSQTLRRRANFERLRHGSIERVSMAIYIGILALVVIALALITAVDVQFITNWQEPQEQL